MKRRNALNATATAVSTLLLGGCIASDADPPTQTNPASGGEDGPESQGPVRGESDAPVDARAVEDDENVEYVVAEDAVRYVAAWRSNSHEAEEGEPPEREPVFETTPFERWGETQCLSAAASAAASHVETELDTDEVSGGITSAVDGEDRAAYVLLTTLLDRDGDVLTSPETDFETLVAATPATVSATYLLDEHEYTLDVPIYVRHEVIQQE
ncbi:hypothetical protein [Haloprofundus salinisoli]|uniref:hypothetical protein n=1 Tax=Haloprofundus salinisoli TaxID=2876193 RepID=UPI001CCAE5A0|nr:hypothetical protein [Haloprofundus salinisoli]